MPAFVHVGRFVVNVDHITHISFDRGEIPSATVHLVNGKSITFLASTSSDVYKTLETLREIAPGLDAVVSYGAVDKHGFLDFDQPLPESEE